MKPLLITAVWLYVILTSLSALAQSAGREGRQPCANITAYGGVGNGVTDNVAAFNLAAASDPTRACVRFPPGRYRFESAVAYTTADEVGASLTIVGAGQDVTELYWPNPTDGIAVTLLSETNSVHVTGLSFTTGAAGGGTALKLRQRATSFLASAYVPQSDIAHVTFRSDEGYTALTHFWTAGVETGTVSGVAFDTVTFQGPSDGGDLAGYASRGTGVVLTGGTATLAPVVYIFNNCVFNTVGTGIVYGDYVQGVAVTQSQFTGVGDGIVAAAGLKGLDQLAVTASQFNAANHGIHLQSVVVDLQISNSLFLVPRAEAVAVAALATMRSTIVGNNFTGLVAGRGVGVTLAATVDKIGGTLVGNNFHSLGIGWTIGFGAAGWTVANNGYFANATDYTNADPTTTADVPTDCSATIALKFGGAATGITYGAKHCRYRRIGKDVWVDLDFSLTSKGSATGAATIENLPVAAAASNGVGVIGFSQNLVAATGLAGNVVGGSTTMGLVLNGATGSDNATDANFTPASRVVIQAHYLSP